MSIEVLEIFLILVGIAFLIYGWRKNSNQSESKMVELINDLMLQIDEDNKEFLFRIKNVNQELKLSIDDKIEELEKRLTQLEKSNKENNLKVINPKYSSVFELYQTGKTIDEIAKELNLGHGEIQLIIELLKKGFPYGENA